MIKEFDFQCKACGASFEELVEVETGSNNTIEELPPCPECESTEVERVPYNMPVHGKHGSWPV
jgi:putative FmdB family regulatory protein